VFFILGNLHSWMLLYFWMFHVILGVAPFLRNRPFAHVVVTVSPKFCLATGWQHPHQYPTAPLAWSQSFRRLCSDTTFHPLEDQGNITKIGGLLKCEVIRYLPKLWYLLVGGCSSPPNVCFLLIGFDPSSIFTQQKKQQKRQGQLDSISPAGNRTS
jgi:hypothetical protein